MPPTTTRRRTPAVLLAVATTASAVGGVAAASAATGSASAANDGRVKNVIYLLGDGMGRTHVTAARERYYGADGHLVMESLHDLDKGVGNRFALRIEHDHVRLAVALAGQDERLRVLDGHIGDARVADDHGVSWSADPQDSGHVDLDAHRRCLALRYRRHGRDAEEQGKRERNARLDGHGTHRELENS